jgi:hypothetical protein
VVGSGSGVWSFLHVDDAAEATVTAVEDGAPGVYNIADDEPAACPNGYRSSQPRWELVGRAGSPCGSRAG